MFCCFGFFSVAACFKKSGTETLNNHSEVYMEDHC